jgi:CDP-4-dehydro-6-deoxyglucose reductase
MPTITLANGVTFKCQPEQTILEAARQNEIALEHSCRTGRCGICKAQVTSGTTVAIKPEESLKTQEQSDNIILTCCRSAESDVYLDIDDLGELGKLQAKTLPCRIVSLQRLAEDVMEVVLRTPPSSKLKYLPGQYVDMIGKDGLRRSYSIANAPREDGTITLQIRMIPNGQMSHYWFEAAKPNDLLRLEGPQGTFCLRNTKNSVLVFMATGTGIAPIKAILEQLNDELAQHTYSKIYLYWGGRKEQDIYWHPNYPELPLTFVPVLSRAQADWPGRTGHIQQVLLHDGVDLEAVEVYACGSEAMIDSALRQLTAAGLNAKYFHSDAFVSSN